MRTTSSQFWGTLLFVGLTAAVSCKGTDDGGTATDAGTTPPLPAAGSPAPGETPNSSDKPADPPADPNNNTKPNDTKPQDKPDEVAVTYAALELVASCDDAAELIRERALALMNAEIDEFKKTPPVNWCARGAVTTGSLPTPPSGSLPQADAAGGDTASETSMTNNQVAGVDEADFIKNDNKYMYAALNGALRIVEAWPAANAHEVANIKLEGTPKKLFVNGDRALVYVSQPRPDSSADAVSAARRVVGNAPSEGECTYGYDCQFGGDGTATTLLVFDITDRAAPKQVRKIELEGSLLAARRIGNAVHTVAVTPSLGFPDVINILQEESCGQTPDPKRDEKYEALRKKNTEIIKNADLTDFLPSVTENGTDFAQKNCDSLYREIQATGTAFTQVVSVDMSAASEPVVATVISKPGPVYASGEALYMAVLSDDGYQFGFPAPTGDQRQLTSAIHKFRVGTDPKATAYAASGKVKGHVLNQFSMDEHENHLRVATSYGKVPNPDVHSTMSVIEQREDKLEVVGMVDKIAPSEDIRSVRFDGDRGFIVTFKKTDPLYAFDLADPKAPKITGELKIPGFSTYMHMLDDKHLLTIGYDAADQGDFAYFTGVLLQIFDVSDPENLKLAHKVSIGTRGTSSEALTNHLAFTLFQGKLAVPMTLCEGGNENGGFGTTMTFSGLMVFDVSVADGIEERGRVAHKNPNTDGYDNAGCSNWWSRAGSVVQRSVFMDDFVYSVASDIVRVQNIDNLGSDVATVSLTK